MSLAPRGCTAIPPLPASPLLLLPPPPPTGEISLPCMKSLPLQHSLPLLPPFPWRACTPSHNGVNPQTPDDVGEICGGNFSSIPLHLSILLFPPHPTFLFSGCSFPSEPLPSSSSTPTSKALIDLRLEIDELRVIKLKSGSPIASWLRWLLWL